MSLPFKFRLDSNFKNTFSLPLSDEVWQIVAPTGSLIILPVPPAEDASRPWTHAVIAATNNYFVSNESFDLPAAGTFTKNPGQLNVPTVPIWLGNDAPAVTNLYFRVRTSCDITVAFFTGFVRNNNPLGT